MSIPDTSTTLAILSEVLGSHATLRSEPRITLDVGHYRPILPEQRDEIERRLSDATGEPVWLIGEQQLSAGVRRLTFTTGEAPDRRPIPPGGRW